jgi:hypothetical protein
MPDLISTGIVDMTINRPTNTNVEDKPIGIQSIAPVELGVIKSSKKGNRIKNRNRNKNKPASWSSEPALDDGYSAAIEPLIVDFKKSVTDAMDSAASVITDVALLVAPIPYIPGTSTAIKAISGVANRFINPIKNVIKNTKPTLSFSTLNPTVGITSKTAIGNLPNLPPVFGRFQTGTRQGMFDALTVVAKGAEVSKTGRIQAISRLSSTEGKKRLFNQEFDFLKSQASELSKSLEMNKLFKSDLGAYQRATTNIFGEADMAMRFSSMRAAGDHGFSKLLSSTENITKQAWKNVGHRIAEISKPNVNELAAQSIIGGKLNYSLGKNVLYTSRPRGFYDQFLKQTGGETNFAKRFLSNQATYGGFRSGSSGFGFDPIGLTERTSRTFGTFGLGAEGGLMNLKTYFHETAHGLQKGVTGNIDRALAKITPKSSVANLENKISKLSNRQASVFDDKITMSQFSKIGDELRILKSERGSLYKDYNYFKTGGSGQLEPSAFGAEVRQSLFERGFIKSDYSKITTDILSKAKISFGKNPLYQGTVSGNKVSGTRLLDFMAPTKSNFSILSKQLNKLPAFAPFIGFGALSGGSK